MNTPQEQLFQEFLLFLEQENKVLSPIQLYVASHFISMMERNSAVLQFMRGQVTGKTTLFEMLEKWSKTTKTVSRPM